MLLAVELEGAHFLCGQKVKGLLQPLSSDDIDNIQLRRQGHLADEVCSGPQQPAPKPPCLPPPVHGIAQVCITATASCLCSRHSLALPRLVQSDCMCHTLLPLLHSGTAAANTADDQQSAHSTHLSYDEFVLKTCKIKRQQSSPTIWFACTEESHMHMCIGVAALQQQASRCYT